MSEAEWRAKAQQLDLLSTELDREIQSYEARNDAMQARATILIAAASVVGSLQFAASDSNSIEVDLIASAIAALLGLGVAAPIFVAVLNMNIVERRLLALGAAEGRATLIDKKIAMLNTNQRRLNVRGVLTIVGFAALLVALGGSYWSATHPEPAQPTHVVIDNN